MAERSGTTWAEVLSLTSTQLIISGFCNKQFWLGTFFSLTSFLNITSRSFYEIYA